MMKNKSILGLSVALLLLGCNNPTHPEIRDAAISSPANGDVFPVLKPITITWRTTGDFRTIGFEATRVAGGLPVREVIVCEISARGEGSWPWTPPLVGAWEIRPYDGGFLCRAPANSGTYPAVRIFVVEK